MPKAKTGAATKMLSIRVDASAFDRLDALAVKLSRPGLDLSRSDAARIALETGIEALEQERSNKPPQS